MANSGELVGHTISKEGRTPVQRIVAKIANAPHPRNRQELQRFLSLVNLYREYIEDMAHLAEPYTGLHEKESIGCGAEMLKPRL